MEKQKRYSLLRAELATFQAEFERRASDLFCERLFDLERVSPEGWRAFASANPSDTWVILPDGEGCLRFSGDVASFETFRRSARSAWLVLATLEKEFLELHIDLGIFGHEFGWFDRVLHTAEAVACARLHIEGDWWDWASDESPADVLIGEMAANLWAGQGDARHPRHPLVQRLSMNVFQASSETIRVWLDPDSVPSVAERIDEISIRLPAELSATEAETPTGIALDPQKPSWDEENKSLWWGSICLKRFSERAKISIPVMRAFEQAGWPLSMPVPSGLNNKKVSWSLGHLNFDAPGVIEICCSRTKSRNDALIRWYVVTR